MTTTLKVLPCSAQFPLGDPTEHEQNEIFRVVFDWRDCTHCANQGICSAVECSWKRKSRLVQYLQFYNNITAWSTPADLNEHRYALSSHKDLLDIVRIIKENPERPRRELMREHFSTYGPPQPAVMDQRRAFDLAMTVIGMIPCSAKNPYYGRLDPMRAPIY
jgi:hypothetical protein